MGTFSSHSSGMTDDEFDVLSHFRLSAAVENLIARLKVFKYHENDVGNLNEVSNAFRQVNNRIEFFRGALSDRNISLDLTFDQNLIELQNSGKADAAMLDKWSLDRFQEADGHKLRCIIDGIIPNYEKLSNYLKEMEQFAATRNEERSRSFWANGTNHSLLEIAILNQSRQNIP